MYYKVLPLFLTPANFISFSAIFVLRKAPSPACCDQMFVQRLRINCNAEKVNHTKREYPRKFLVIYDYYLNNAGVA